MSDIPYNILQTGKIWAALNEHQHHPGSVDDLFDYMTKLYGVKPIYTLTYDQESKPCYNLSGYEVVDLSKHGLFLLKYGDK